MRCAAADVLLAVALLALIAYGATFPPKPAPVHHYQTCPLPPMVQGGPRQFVRCVDWDGVTAQQWNI